MILTYQANHVPFVNGLSIYNLHTVYLQVFKHTEIEGDGATEMLHTGKKVLVWIEVGLPMHFYLEVAHCLGVVTHTHTHTYT